MLQNDAADGNPVEFARNHAPLPWPGGTSFSAVQIASQSFRPRFRGRSDATEVLFVDTGVEQADVLTADLTRNVEVLTLPRSGDVLSWIAGTLSDRCDLESIHLLSHGAPGRLHLAGQDRSLLDFLSHPDIAMALRRALRADGRIVLYGCSLGAGEAGRSFVAGLSAVAGVRVVAADHPVGHRTLGGDWATFPDTDLAFGSAGQEAFRSLLASGTFDFTGSTSSTTVTQTVSGVTVNISIDQNTTNGGDTTIDVFNGSTYGGTDGNIVSFNNDYLPLNTVVTFSFTGGPISLTSFQFVEARDWDNGNYVFMPTSGTTLTLAATDLSTGDTPGTTVNSTSELGNLDQISTWTNITGFTVTYTGTGGSGNANWQPAFDTLVFADAVVTPTSATSTAAGFDTTAGTNLTPSFTFGASNETLTIAASGHIAGSTANGGDGTDTIVAPDGSDFSGFTSLTNFETLTLAESATVTMSESQYEAFTTVNGNTGTETIVLSSANGDGTVIGSANIESFTLNGVFTFTIGTAGQNVTGSDAASQSVRSAADVDVLSGILNGGAGGSDNLVLDTGDNLASATISNFETLNLVGSASVTMTVAQHDSFVSITGGGGSDQITFSAGADTVTTGSAAVETYVLGTAGITFTLGTATQNVTGSAGADIVNVAGLTVTGTLNGNGATDILQMDTGGNIAGAALSNFENLTLTANASVTMTATQFTGFISGVVTADGVETVTLSGDGNLATYSTVESYVVNDSSTDTRTVTVNSAGHSVSATSNTDAVTFDAGALSLTGTLTGEGTVNDTLSISNGANIAGGMISAIENLTLGTNASVTMTAAQHAGFTGTVTADGGEQITLSATGGTTTLTGNSAVETYVLGTGGMTFTLGAAAQTLSGSTGDDIVNVGTFTASGTVAGGDGTGDTLQMGTGANIAGTTVSGFENLSLTDGASVTISAAQHAQFTGTVTADGSETVTVTGNGAFTTLANVETYSVGDDGTNARTITLGGGGTSVTASSGTDAVTFNVGTLTLTGTLTGDGGTADTVQIGNGGNIAGGTLTNVSNLTLASGASATMTLAQFQAFNTISGAGSETVALSGDGNLSTVTEIESYVLGDSTANSRTVTINAAAQSVSASSNTDAIVFNAGGLTLTGTLTGEASVADTLELSTGANTSGGTISGISSLTLANDAQVTMTAAQLNGFSGTVTAAGTETVTLTSTGTVASASLSAIETIATASDATGQTVTMTAAQAAGRTLTAGDSGVDHFVVTGSLGDQTIVGSAGADTLSGGAGADTLSGGNGTDILVGGAGNDVFAGSAAALNGDTVSDFAIGDSIVVTGDLSNLNGNTASSTVSLGGGQELTLTGISSSSGTWSAVHAAGSTTIALVAPSSGGGDSGSGSGGSSGTIVITPSTPTTGSGGSGTTTGQTITNNGTTSGSAAIVQNTNNNGNLVTATLPPSTTITSEGPTTAQSPTDALTTLVTSIQARSSSAEAPLVSGAQTFLANLATTSTLDVRTIIPTTTTSSLTSPIVITGTNGGSQSEAFVIDMRSLPTGSTLQLDNIEFASIMGSTTVNGGEGNNYVTADDNSQFISLGVGDDTLFGGSGADTIGSGSGADQLYGEDGNDMVFGGTEADTVVGGANEDVVYGNQANDVVYGNQGYDTLYGGQNEDTLYGGQHQDLLYGNNGQDVLYGNLSEDTLYGGQGEDTLFGGDGQDVLNGNIGADLLSGGAGADTLVGGDGNDTLYGGLSSAGGGDGISFDILSGGAGDDIFHGGEGIDWIFTGAGADKVYVDSANGYDVIGDFSLTEDQIVIRSTANGQSFTSAADVIARATNNADGDVEIDLGGQYVRLIGIQTSQLTESIFGFY